MQYSQIPSKDANAVSSIPTKQSSRSYSLKHIVAGVVGAMLLTALALHTLKHRPAAYPPTPAAPSALLDEDAMYTTSRGFRPNDTCSKFLGKGRCAGMLEKDVSYVVRQCSATLDGAAPTVCNCGGFGISGGDAPVVLSSELSSEVCVCKFSTGTPDQSVWTMELKCK